MTDKEILLKQKIKLQTLTSQQGKGFHEKVYLDFVSDKIRSPF